MTESAQILVQSRSKACATCIKRKTKCDKTRPVCSQCIKAGWQCPGYVKVWTKRETKGRKTRPRYDQEWLPGQELQHEPLESRPKGVKVAIRRKSQAQSTSPTSIDLFSLSATPSDSSLMVQLVDHLEENKPPGMTIRNLGSFFPFIPSRLGHSRALDDAVQCICTSYSALLCSNGSAIGQDRREYYQALRSLRLACQDKDEVLSSNVLCAAVLLSWYEILADNLDDSWITHVGGCATLVQLRGPARHQTGFDHALLKAEEGSMTIDSFLKHRPCFLDTPPWRSIVDHPTELSELRSSAVGPVNATLARLSTLINELDNLSSLSSFEAEQTILAFCTLRNDIRARLALSLKGAEIHTPIICCKDSNYLLLIDTTLLQLLDSPDLSQEIFSLVLGAFNFEAQNITLPFFRQYLETQVQSHFEMFKEKLVLASRATPFSMRKMCFLCRVMGEERRRRKGTLHPVWVEFEQAIQGISERGWVERVKGEVVEL
ncbi:hypothetical protein L207DRAFT_585898 [Hyaloscypha variabilis F]|uniref:Zn(2)-C6 fungal-type domain-containing protein n=1 Tax=Hyaloscypha variabilis (strain UAMH 11265 / GT02V1 / F) TaxID=1149755 RepID=A0A2J6RGA8_HYAVF|nr:hypothetical protein L207DRAFT_585898 [Hyaloscypha variabilis F]